MAARGGAGLRPLPAQRRGQHLGEAEPRALERLAREGRQGRLFAYRSGLPGGDPDLAVVISWNTGDSDVDLHVIEPGGEECYYGRRATAQGGQLSADVTQGFGPELYLLPRAAPGDYQVRANFFTSQRNRLSARTRVLATVVRDLGRPAEEVTTRTISLADSQDMHELASVHIPGPAAP